MGMKMGMGMGMGIDCVAQQRGLPHSNAGQNRKAAAAADTAEWRRKTLVRTTRKLIAGCRAKTKLGNQ